MSELKKQVLNIVSKIPKGKITSYGEIAKVVGSTGRTVGFIMTGLSEAEAQVYPWYRVVNKQGFISSSKLGTKGNIQQAMLETEGVEIKEFQIVQPEKYWWNID